MDSLFATKWLGHHQRRKSIAIKIMNTIAKIMMSIISLAVKVVLPKEENFLLDTLNSNLNNSKDLYSNCL